MTIWTHDERVVERNPTAHKTHMVRWASSSGRADLLCNQRSPWYFTDEIEKVNCGICKKRHIDRAEIDAAFDDSGVKT